MKRLALLLSLLVFTATFTFASVDQYFVDDQAIESVVSNAQEVTIPSDMMPTHESVLSSDKNPWVAWGLTFTYAVGICGIHRLYLGSNIGVFIGYLLTVGGCGIIQTVDWVVLLIGAINDDISKYVDNTKFFMWL